MWKPRDGITSSKQSTEVVGVRNLILEIEFRIYWKLFIDLNPFSMF
jgi:hypothetical protein